MRQQSASPSAAIYEQSSLFFKKTVEIVPLELFIIENYEMRSLAQVLEGLRLEASWEAAGLLNIKV